MKNKAVQCGLTPKFMQLTTASTGDDFRSHSSGMSDHHSYGVIPLVWLLAGYFLLLFLGVLPLIPSENLSHGMQTLLIISP